MTLGEAQRQFTRLLADLILWAYSEGFELSLGEAWRTPEQARLNAATGKGISNSLHLDRLAIDLNLFKDGQFLTATEDHRPLGEYWEQMGKERGLPLCWGGRFNDANHYSFAWGGRK